MVKPYSAACELENSYFTKMPQIFQVLKTQYLLTDPNVWELIILEFLPAEHLLCLSGFYGSISYQMLKVMYILIFANICNMLKLSIGYQIPSNKCRMWPFSVNEKFTPAQTALQKYSNLCLNTIKHLLIFSSWPNNTLQ